MRVLKRVTAHAHTHAHAHAAVKIQAPLTIDYTKQAAIMLMTGHTKSKLSQSPSYVMKKPSPVRRTPAGKGRRTTGTPARRTTGTSARRTTGNPAGRTTGTPAGRTTGTPAGRTTGSPSGRTTRTPAGRSRATPTGNQEVSSLEVSESTSRSDWSSSSVRCSKSPRKSPALPSPKKSALKDTSKKSTRKTESIKFDLSNLENQQDSDVMILQDSKTDVTQSDEDLTLYYSESSVNKSLTPSPRRSIHSRSSRIMEKLGTTITQSPSKENNTLTPKSPNSRKSTRGSLIVQKALNDSTLSDNTRSNSTVDSAFRTRTLSPKKNMESYSIVDLVSLDSNEMSDNSKSVYNSADSSATDYGTPHNSSRKTISSLYPVLVDSSTPYNKAGVRQTRSKSSPNVTQISTRSSMRRSKSLTTPENKVISVNSTRVSRRSRSRSRINDSDLLLLDDSELEDSSPKTSKRTRSKNTVNKSSARDDGTTTPENRKTPEDPGTPILSIQTLLNSSQSSLTSQSPKKGRQPNYKRNTIAALSEPKRRGTRKAHSLGGSARKTVLRLSRDSEVSDKTDEGAPKPDNEETITPKSAVKLVPEAVKNKHSTAKKPQSKRSIIDDLDRSDLVKQLFNSPVKRKLSQSMTEFSRKRLLDDEEMARQRRPTRNTVTFTGQTPDNSLLNNDDSFTPERFVSPIHTPENSPNLSGIKRLFKKTTPDNDLRNVRGVRNLLRTPRNRKSLKNDLTNVSGVKATFAKSPRNRLSDVRVKEMFNPAPNNDLTRVSGVKSLFRQNKSPKNDLTNIRGVKQLFAKNSPKNDLRNVSGVKKTMRRNSPNDDLTDVRGVRRMFKGQKRREESGNLSGVEELFDSSTHSLHDSEALFDRLVGKPVIKAVYSKTFTAKKPRKNARKQKSLHTSLDLITNNVEEWLEKELQKRLHTDKVAKELQRLATDTVQGEAPVQLSRTRNSSIKRSASEIYEASTLPIKKRSLVEASLEKSRNKSKNMLPIKKRVVLHSTPVKGRLNITMNASELGRVSPIPIPIPAIPAIPAAERTKGGTRSRRQALVVVQKLKPLFTAKSASPKKPTPSKKTPTKRATRAKKETDNTKKRRSSLVITKKAPTMAPEPGAETSESPKKTRAKISKVETPKKTRARAKTATVVVTKPSPKFAARRNAKPAQKETQEPPKPPKTRKTKAVTIAPEASELVSKRGRTRADTSTRDVSKRTRATKPQNGEPQRGRQEKAEANIEKVEKPKRGRKTKETTVESVTTEVKRGRRTKVETAVVDNVQTEPKRGRRTKAETTGAKVVPIEVKRGRRNTDITVVKELVEKPKRGRKTKAESSAESVPTEAKRGRRTDAELTGRELARPTPLELTERSLVKSGPVKRGRATKVETDQTVEAKPTRGRKKNITLQETVTGPPKTRQRGETYKQESTSSEATPSRTRVGKKAADVRTRDTRKRKAEADQEVAKKKATVRGGDTGESGAPPPPPAITTRRRRGVEPKENVSEGAKQKRQAAAANRVAGGGRTRRR